MKRKLLGLLLLSMATSLWFFSAGNTSADHGGPHVTAAPLPTVYTCYDLEKGEDVKTDVTLITKSYGKDAVQVRELVMLCELSTMYPFGHGYVPAPPPVADTAIFACYALRGGSNPNEAAILTTPSFGSDAVVVGTSHLMCEAARKHVTNAAGATVTFGAVRNAIWQCFRLGKGADPNQDVNLTNNNFGLERVTVRTGIAMCEEGEKHRLINGQWEVTGLANGVAYECFRLERGNDPQQVVVLETENFGRDEVVVRRASQVCQVAEKKPILIGQITPVWP